MNRLAVEIRNNVSHTFNLLFNIILELVIRDSGLNTRGTIFNNAMQVLAYADKLDIIARNSITLKRVLPEDPKSP